MDGMVDSIPLSALAELLALADRLVSEWSRPLSDRKVETTADRSWPTAAESSSMTLCWSITPNRWSGAMRMPGQVRCNSTVK
jgi:hypothetical protein